MKGVQTIFSVGSNPEAIVSGPDGNLWLTEQGANKIARITTSGTLTEYTIPTAGAGLVGIALGPDGNIWFCENTTNKIGKFVY